jgi:hypothetical protein
LALADAPSYRIANPLLGTFVIKSEGGCDIAKKTFDNAQFGSVVDQEDSYLGLGLLSANGALLGLLDESGPPMAVAKMVVHDNGDFSASGFLSIAGDFLKNYLESTAKAGCEIATLMPDMNSSFDYGMDGNSERLTVDGVFSGYTDASRCKDRSDAVECKARRFSGSVKFSSHP